MVKAKIKGYKQINLMGNKRVTLKGNKQQKSLTGNKGKFKGCKKVFGNP